MTTALGYTFKNPALLQEALTHPSYKHISKTERDYNRLEFLGDSVLNLIISDLTFAQYPNVDEGELSILHSNLVSKGILAQLAKINGLDQMLLMDHGEVKNAGRTNPNNLENTFEAVIAAIFLDSDYPTTRTIVTQLYTGIITDEALHKDAKSELQEWFQQNFHSTPYYHLVAQKGEAHKPIFEMELTLHDGEITHVFTAQAPTKKAAEFAVATKALHYIKNMKK